MSSQYRAFISYSHKDAKFAASLQRKLEAFRHPHQGRGGFPLRPIFLDRSELASSPSLSDAVNAALSESEALIVICSPDAAASQWVNAEILQFKRLGKAKILPLIIRGVPGSTQRGDECFPDSLRFQLNADGTLSKTPVEPLAADMRKGHDGPDAILKLIAGLLEIPFDSLKLRQQRRRVKQALSAASVAVAMLVITASLGIVAMVARQDAEAKRDQAEKLIAFMLGDLRERLQPVGRLDVLEGVGEQALEYFSSLSASEMTSASTLTRVTALRQIGEVRVAQGLTNEGLVAFNEALALISSSPTRNEGVQLFELGQINYWIADAYFKQLRLDDAQVHIERYLGISRDLVALEPTNPAYRLELLYAESNLGTLAFRANDMDIARDHFSSALAIGRDLGGDGSRDADTISWLGSIEACVGNLGAALRWHGEELGIRRKRLDANDEPEQRHSLGRTLLVLTDVQHQAGQLEGAVKSADESINIYSQLTRYDPQNFRWNHDLARALTLYARDGYALARINAIQARAILERASERMERTNGDASAETVRVLAAIAIERARIELIDGHPAVADRSLLQTLGDLAPLSTGPDRVRIMPIYARALYLGVEAAIALGDEPMARTRAVSALESLGVRSNDHIDIKVYAALLAHIARRPDAQRRLSEVAVTEYRGPAPLPRTDAERWWRTAVPLS